MHVMKAKVERAPTEEATLPPTDSPTDEPSTMPTTSHLPSLAPSTSPAPTVYCADSTLMFNTKDSNNKKYKGKTCEWISGRKTNERCAFENVETHCPATCGTCDPCSDSKAKFFLQQATATTNCKKIKKDNKCAEKGVFHTCRATCGLCPSLTPSNVPSLAPSASPSKIHSVGPSTSPSTLPPTMLPSTVPSNSPAPTIYCKDSTLAFNTKDSNDKKYKNKTCEWVDEKTKKRCAFDNVETHCPATCDTCGPCSDSKATFILNDKRTNCKKIKKDNKCAEKGVSRTCRESCGLCPSLTPSNVPSIEPTISMLPSSNPTSAPTCYGGQNSGYLEEVSKNPSCALYECAGNCKKDDDCHDGLICHKRKGDNDRNVPFCIGTAYLNFNYCIRMSSEVPSFEPSYVPSSLPSIVPSSAPSVATSSMPSRNPSSLPSVAPSSMPSTLPSSMPSTLPTL